MPSLQAPKGPVLAPVGKEPRGVRSAAFQRETLLPEELVTRMRWPSKAAAEGSFNPLPVNVWMTAPVEARTTETELEEALGTQMFVPSKAGSSGRVPIPIANSAILVRWQEQCSGSSGPVG